MRVYWAARVLDAGMRGVANSTILANRLAPEKSWNSMDYIESKGPTT